MRRYSMARHSSAAKTLNNEYLGADGQRHAIPPTLLISAIGRYFHDINTAVTMDLKAAGNSVYIVGGGQWMVDSDQSVPDVHEKTPRVYQALHKAIQRHIA